MSKTQVKTWYELRSGHEIRAKFNYKPSKSEIIAYQTYIHPQWNLVKITERVKEIKNP